MSEINRLKRRMANLSGQGCYTNPAEEWDRRRQNLAEELLKIALDEQQTNYFSDSEPVRDPDPDSFDTRAVVTIEEWFLKLAHASLAAAEVIYPDLEQEPVLPLADIPAAAQAGATAVMPAGVEPFELILGRD